MGIMVLDGRAILAWTKSSQLEKVQKWKTDSLTTNEKQTPRNESTRAWDVSWDRLAHLEAIKDDFPQFDLAILEGIFQLWMTFWGCFDKLLFNIALGSI